MTDLNELQRRLARGIANAIDLGHMDARVDLVGLTADLLDQLAGGPGDPIARCFERARRFKGEADREQRRVELHLELHPNASHFSTSYVATINARIAALRSLADRWDDLGRWRGAGLPPDRPAGGPQDSSCSAETPIAAPAPAFPR